MKQMELNKTNFMIELNFMILIIFSLDLSVFYIRAYKLIFNVIKR